MIEYERITAENIAALKPFFETYACGICDNTIGAVYQWRDIYVSYYAIVEGMLCIRAGYGEYGECYTVPLGCGDFAAACAANEADAKHRGIPLRYCVVPCCAMPPLKARYGDRMGIESIRDWADYLYDAEHFRTFAGKAYHGQKNHVNRFYRDHPYAYAAAVTDAETERACLAFLEAKVLNREDDGGDPGLRYSKMSYKPRELREKFLVTVRDGAEISINQEENAL